MYKLPCEEKFAAFGAPSESSLDLGWFSQGVFRLFVLLHTGVFRVGRLNPFKHVGIELCGFCKDRTQSCFSVHLIHSGFAQGDEGQCSMAPLWQWTQHKSHPFLSDLSQRTSVLSLWDFFFLFLLLETAESKAKHLNMTAPNQLLCSVNAQGSGHSH